MQPETFLLLIAALFGAIIGSFLNVVILRLPEKNASIVFPASHCPKCLTPLSWYENIPVLSYITLRGKCAHCHTSISLQYPAVEILTGLFAAAICCKFNLSIQTGAYFLFGTALIVIIVIDIHHQIIPDIISLPGILLGFLFSFINSGLTWQSSLTGLLLGGGVLYTIAFIYSLLRKQDGMGGGDIKLLAMIGAWLGWQSLPFVILISSVTGSITGLIAMKWQKKGGNTRIPFGPFLSGGALLYIFYSEKILHFYHLYITGQWP